MVDAVLEIMQKAVVPWSNVVEKLVQHYLEMDGPKYAATFLNLIPLVSQLLFLIACDSIFFFFTDKNY